MTARVFSAPSRRTIKRLVYLVLAIAIFLTAGTVFFAARLEWWNAGIWAACACGGWWNCHRIREKERA